MIRRAALIVVALAFPFAIAGPAAAQDATTTAPSTTAPTTTIELSAPVVTSSPPVAPTTSVETEVLGAQETNADDELALTGAAPLEAAALGLGFLAAGAVLARRGRRRD